MAEPTHRISPDTPASGSSPGALLEKEAKTQDKFEMWDSDRGLTQAQHLASYEL